MQNIAVQEIAEKIKAEFHGDINPQVSDVTHDSRQVGKGTLFVAVRGLTMDGHRFVDDVMRRGAVGIISELEAPKNFQGAWLKVKDARSALAQSAAIINGNPSHDLKLVGITGTNGKTTTTYLCFALAEANHEKAAMLTTAAIF
ncbi:MAG: Mur ligase domain-containing protein [Acidobacteria bacterium]|nr:Mur ligase domain-containing protein [Acidobacteriota bacterium]